MSELPVVLLPVGVDDDALDACLAALEQSTPAGTRVWLADNAQAGPRGTAIIECWLRHTALRADYTRRAQAVAESAHVGDMLRACGGLDVAVLAADSQPLPGWLQQLDACLARDASIVTATPWCNAGETAAWPRLGDIAPAPDFERAAQACTAMPALHPELPAAVAHAVVLRGSACQRVGGVDASSYGSWYAALADLSLRLAGLGGRNVLCENAFVVRNAEVPPCDGDMDALYARWPSWSARLAEFLMHDPLRAQREQMAMLYARAGPPERQRGLFE